MKKPKWDTELGKLLWLEGKCDGEIADELHIPTSSVTSYRRRHWEKELIRKEDAPPVPQEETAEQTEGVSATEDSVSENEESVIACADPVSEAYEIDIRNEENDMGEKKYTSPDIASVPAKKPLEVYEVLEAATADMKGIQAICTADAIMCLWNWESKEDLLKARSSIDYLLRRLEG